MTDNVLAVMMDNQGMLQQKLGYDLVLMKPDERMEYIRTMTLACTDELHEAMNETGWKPWASSNHINREEWMGEMTDAWLFLMNLMLAGGMTADDLIVRTAQKQDNAFQRSQQEYDGVSTKCPTCKRAYDNKGVKCTPDTGCAYELIAVPEGHHVVATPTPFGPADGKHCRVCGTDFGLSPCHDQDDKKQGYGWCQTYRKSFYIKDNGDFEVLNGLATGA